MTLRSIDCVNKGSVNSVGCIPLSNTCHIPVLSQEILDWLLPAEWMGNAQPGSVVVVDGTLGGGGHTRLMAQRISDRGHVFGFDRDPGAVERFVDILAADKTSTDQVENITAICANFADIPRELGARSIQSVDCILLDLGLSSDQLADHQRGFSYHADGPLDMRFDPSAGEPAWKLLQRLNEKHLADLIYQFGEERHSRRVARAIVRQRQVKPIKSVSELAEIVRRCVPRSRKHAIDPATRTFQALRIAVNDELRWVESALKHLPALLKPGGRMGVISFHSLEDRLTKNAFRDHSQLKVLTRKPVRPDQAEIETNPRSRSSRFRVAEKIEANES